MAVSDSPILLPRIQVLHRDPIDALFHLENAFTQGCILWSMLALITYSSSMGSQTLTHGLTHMNSPFHSDHGR